MEASDKNLVRSYFTDSSADNEACVTSIYLNSNNDEELKVIAHEHWDESPSAKVELQHILNRIHFQINSKVEKQSAITRFMFYYLRIAAVLLIPLAILGIYSIIKNPAVQITSAEIKAANGSRVQFTLPDGSTGYLNGGSSLKYSTNFSVDRTLRLSGEVFLEVAKDRKHPFTVQTKLADVQVYGTKFDVCAYDSDMEVSTTLEEGSVRIYNKKLNTYSMLDPGEQNVIRKADGNMQTKPVNTDLYTSWKAEMLRFNNSTFDEVVKKMERWYGVRIILDKSLKYSENYTFTVRTESLKELLELLSITTPMSYEIDNNTVTIYPLKKKSME